MTRTRYRIFETESPYFMTCTIVGWLAVFTRPEAVQIVFDCWKFLFKEKNFKLYGYVVLENHLHLIASAPTPDSRACPLAYSFNDRRRAGVRA